MKELKVIFHVDEMKKWGLTLMNIGNFIAEDEDAEIICLANAEAVKGFAKDPLLAEKMGELMVGGVEFIACNNALKNFKIDSGDLLEGVGIVPAGVVELARKQVEGYAYIKP